ncbi:hypothetical protein IV203_035283 [Nitzschia inconspicua]|uniref:Uncharacterized protein n=1 Tax=Nitzschia inconspicua TaxID=303405 RepID=A0A9K3LD68_9STRA|nr:hypothetical protein IV203_035283 [Nitzschia inconspicua]
MKSQEYTLGSSGKDTAENIIIFVGDMNNKKEINMLNNSLPCDLVQYIANHYLNPIERTNLSYCNKCLHNLLPPLLQIVIAASQPRLNSSESGQRPHKCQKIQLKHAPQTVLEEVYATPLSFWNDGDEYKTNNLHGHSKMPSYDRTLKFYDRLVYGTRYVFWKFDSERQIPVFLGRHTRHAVKDSRTSSFQYRYSMAMRPHNPNQSWEVISSSPNPPGSIVQWGDEVGLTVGGESSCIYNSCLNQPRHADSLVRTFLSCLQLPQSSTNNNQTRQLDDDDTTPSDSVSTSTQSTWSWYSYEDKLGPNERLILSPKATFHRTSAENHHEQPIQKKKFLIHAIPDACDEGEYLLYSPESLQQGVASCDGFHVKVQFDHWIEKGIMHVRAPVLPFTLSMPILDCDYFDNEPKSPLANLLHIKSARWGCLIYYIAVAADVSEGKTLDMDRFLRRVTDHQDHTVRINAARDLVYIDVRDKMVKLNASDLPRQGTDASSLSSSSAATIAAPWCFLLSW